MPRTWRSRRSPSRRNARLRLFDGDAGAALPRLRRRLRRHGRGHLLRGQGELEHRRRSGPWRASAPARTWSPAASCGRRWPPACRPGASSSPASARPRDEMAAALTAGVMQINVESQPELDALAAVARSLGVRAPVALRGSIPTSTPTPTPRSPPGAARTSSGSNGRWPTGSMRAPRAMPEIDVVGIAAHIGSQLTDLEPFREAFHRLRDLLAMLRADGHDIRTLDLGGGLGIPYGDEDAPLPSPAAYAEVVRSTVGDLGCRLILEPGRLLVGNAGDAGHAHRLRQGGRDPHVRHRRRRHERSAARRRCTAPTTRSCRYASRRPTPRRRAMDIVGPICETGDTFGHGRAAAAGRRRRSAGRAHRRRLRRGRWRRPTTCGRWWPRCWSGARRSPSFASGPKWKTCSARQRIP